MCRVVHVPRVSCCTLLRQNPGNCTENPPSSPPWRDWPACLAVGAGRSEPVSSPRCGYCPSSAAQRTRGSSCDGAGLSESSWELGALGEPSLDFAPGVRLVLGGRLSQTERSHREARPPILEGKSRTSHSNPVRASACSNAARLTSPPAFFPSRSRAEVYEIPLIPEFRE